MADFGTKTGTKRTVSIGTDADLPAVLESKRNTNRVPFEPKQACLKGLLTPFTYAVR